VVREQPRQQEAEAAGKKASRSFARGGIPVVDWPNPTSWHAQQARPLSYLAGVDDQAHASEPCHAASINPAGEVFPICTDPARHPRPEPSWSPPELSVEQQATGDIDSGHSASRSTGAMAIYQGLQSEVYGKVVLRNIGFRVPMGSPVLVVPTSVFVEYRPSSITNQHSRAPGTGESRGCEYCRALHFVTKTFGSPIVNTEDPIDYLVSYVGSIDWAREYSPSLDIDATGSSCSHDTVSHFFGRLWSLATRQNRIDRARKAHCCIRDMNLPQRHILHEGYKGPQFDKGVNSKLGKLIDNIE
jgi:hypothetical protein